MSDDTDNYSKTAAESFNFEERLAELQEQERNAEAYNQRVAEDAIQAEEGLHLRLKGRRFGNVFEAPQKYGDIDRGNKK